MHKVLRRIPESLSEPVGVDKTNNGFGGGWWYVRQWLALTREVRRVVQATNLITSINRASLKIGRLVHVNPKTIKADVFMEPLYLCFPVYGGIRVEEVWIDGQIGPDTTNQ